jgi:error-prone DNA polymerase
MPSFVHLHVHSVFSFLDSTCRLDRLVARAAELGMPAVAVTDHDGTYGAVRFYQAAQEAGIKPILGVELTTEGGHHLPLLATSRAGYANLCRMATAGHFRVLREAAGEQAPIEPVPNTRATGAQWRKMPRCNFSTIAQCAEDVIALSGCRFGEIPAAVRRGDIDAARRAICRYQDIFGRDRFFIELCREEPDEKERPHIARLADLAEEMDALIVATANVHCLTPEEAAVQDVLACIQTLTKRDEWHPIRRRGAERYFKSPREMLEEFASYPQAIANTVRIAAQCEVDLELGQLHFPHFRMREYGPQIGTVSGASSRNTESSRDTGKGRRQAPAQQRPGWWPTTDQEVEGKLAEELLEWLCWEGAARRYRIPAERLRSSPTSPISARLRHELNIIRELGLCEYFLVVWDIVEEARERGIRCAGRGSAADSMVSYALGITPVDPLAARLLFERFLNPERREMPDIDIDFDSRKRDEMIEYVAERYGPEHTGMVATVNTYNARSALREVGKALGMPEQSIDRISRSMPYIPAGRIRDAIANLPELRGSGFDAAALKELLDICETIDGFPRHLSVHLGGVVISRHPITNFTPLEVSAKGVIVCQFDKDDIEALGLVKMDMLGLRNLAAIEEALHIIRETRGRAPDLNRISLDDEKTYELMRSARTVGVFQLESPGMRGLLSGLQPTRFDDIIANISLFRPGPMQADMISPFLARRHGKEPTTYLHPSVRPALEETYGVILYQEQVLEVASALAGFTLGQSDSLRRAMTHDRSAEEMEKIRGTFLDGCRKRGIEKATAEEAFRRLSAFAAYGFCKAHAASFAIIAYETAYLKAHYPAEFLAGILSNQPMGFYPPEVIVNDAKHFGVEVRAVDINKSRDRYWVEEGAIRVGLAQVYGLSAAGLKAVLAAREDGGPFKSLRDFCARTNLARPMVESLIKAGAFDCIGRRRELLWQLNEITTTDARRRDRTHQLGGQLPLLADDPEGHGGIGLPPATERERAAAELSMTGISFTRHPLSFAREHLHKMGVVNRAQLESLPDGRRVRVAGIVIARQRPPIKSGQTVVFITLEDETGLIEVTVFERIYKQWGKVIFANSALIVDGILQKRGRYGTVVLGRRFHSLRP